MTLFNSQNNPLIVPSHSESSSLRKKFICEFTPSESDEKDIQANLNLNNLMPRSFSHSQSPNPVVTPILDRKRKFETEFPSTPIYKQNPNLITPPRSSKRSKTAPSSPINSAEIYETPKTPSFRHDFNINLPLVDNNNIYNEGSNSNYQYIMSSPEYYPGDNDAVNVTPPESEESSPKLSTASLNQPSVTLNRSSKDSVYQYHYPDTCYPFNISGSSVRQTDINLKLKTWRATCTEKVKHEFNKSLKEYSSYSEKLSSESRARAESLKQAVPDLHNTQMFPNFNRLNNLINKGISYPMINKNDGNLEGIAKAKEEAHLLLSLRDNGSNFSTQSTDKEAKIPLQNVTNKVQLPPISEVLKLIPIDKSTIHPSGLSALEVEQYRNPNTMSILLNKNETNFYNGREIKLGQNIQQFDCTYQPQVYHQYMAPQSQAPTIAPPPLITTLQLPRPIPMTLPVMVNKNENVQAIRKTRGSNAFDDLNAQLKDLNHTKEPPTNNTNNKIASNTATNNIKQFQNKFKTQNNVLKVSKTRRSNSSVSQKSSNSSSRKSSNSEREKYVLNNLTTEKISQKRTRSRSRSRSATRTSSIDSIKTTEIPVSMQSTPKIITDVKYNVNISNSLLLPCENMIVPTPNNTQPIKENGVFTNEIQHTHTHSHPNNRSNKTCMSCHSSSSPCWRPSWSPDDGQLCNSCGLRYRKTKARCYNQSCLKIPSKSEWSLMVKRGKLLLDIYDNEGNVVGKEMSYRCLDCDSAMEMTL